MVFSKVEHEKKMNSEKKPFCLIVIILFIIILATVIMHSCGVSQRQRTKYLSMKSNFVTICGVVTKISYSDDKKQLFISLDHFKPKLDGNCFVLEGSNLIIAQNNGIDLLLNVGDEIELITAPQYFWDGYCFPIAELKNQGVVFLDFLTGFNNIQQ